MPDINSVDVGYVFVATLAQQLGDLSDCATVSGSNRTVSTSSQARLPTIFDRGQEDHDVR